MFFRPEYFFVLRDKGLLVPDISVVRVNRSPAPDIGYFVNLDFLLESHGEGRNNMSFVGAKKGIYDPNKVLRKKTWSVSNLDFSVLYPER